MKKLFLLVLVFALVALPMVMAAPSITGRVTCEEDPNDPYCTPEFTTIGAGIAVIGAGIAYSLIRKRK
jgi:hypothetical protein